MHRKGSGFYLITDLGFTVVQLVVFKLKVKAKKHRTFRFLPHNTAQFWIFTAHLPHNPGFLPHIYRTIPDFCRTFTAQSAKTVSAISHNRAFKIALNMCSCLPIGVALTEVWLYLILRCKI